MRSLVIGAVLLSGPGSLAVQAQPAPSEPCTYQSCALRIQDGQFLAGVQGQKVGSFGFLSAPHLRPWIEVSNSASYYVDQLERNYVSGEVASLSGMVLYAVGFIGAAGWDGSDQWGAVGVSAAGFGLSMWGRRRVSRARAAAQSAVWWYNESFATGRGRSVPAPFHVPQDRGAAGAVLGAVVGVASGLFVSSRHSSSEAVQGVAETAAFGAAGGLLGWRIGLQIRK